VKQITLEDVEKFLGADEHAAEEGEELVAEAELRVRDIVGELCDLRMGVGVNLERNRVLKLWYEFYTNLGNMVLPDATIPVTKTRDASLRLGHAIATGRDMIVDPEESEVSAEGVFTREQEDQEDVFAKEHDSIDRELLARLIRLMAKAGTRCNGAKAAWTIEEIQHGFKMASPETTLWQIESALKYLKKQEVVTSFESGKAGLILYLVCDKYDEYLKCLTGAPDNQQIDEHEALLEDLRQILQSNRDIKGHLLPWTTHGLVFALRDKYAWADASTVRDAAMQIEGCREVGDGNYLWTKETAIPVDAEFVQVIEESSESK